MKQPMHATAMPEANPWIGEKNRVMQGSNAVYLHICSVLGRVYRLKYNETSQLLSAIFQIY